MLVLDMDGLACMSFARCTSCFDSLRGKRPDYIFALSEMQVVGPSPDLATPLWTRLEGIRHSLRKSSGRLESAIRTEPVWSAATTHHVSVVLETH